MSFLGERRKIRARKIRILDMELESKSKAISIAWADRDAARNRVALRVFLLLRGDVVERTSEAGGIADSEQVLWRSCTRLIGAIHRRRHRQIDRDGMRSRVRIVSEQTPPTLREAEIV